MSPAGHLPTGRRTVIREVYRGRVWTERPVTVVRHDVDGLVSHLAEGTVIRYPRGAAHGRTSFEMWRDGRWTLEDRVFAPPGMVRLWRTGDPFEVFGALVGSRGVSHWYVNLQEPLRRSGIGFDTMDEVLDLVVAPDARSWERKDVDELEIAVELGRFSEADLERVVAACADLEAQLERGSPPWDLEWARWRPERAG